MVSRYKNNLRIADHKAVLATKLFLFAAFYLSYSNCILRLNKTAVDPERNLCDDFIDMSKYFETVFFLIE